MTRKSRVDAPGRIVPVPSWIALRRTPPSFEVAICDLEFLSSPRVNRDPRVLLSRELLLPIGKYSFLPGEQTSVGQTSAFRQLTSAPRAQNANEYGLVGTGRAAEV